ncbi:MAG TPA: molybdenum cofactor guanylyltransferase [Acidimicrobiales bacterium]|nr:molybdenum cofactor guanylyltransferase [Acidimicrobiales bacterium]
MLGAVLTGGASTRMGRDKAAVEVDGVAMATRVADALRAGGAHAVARIGTDVADAFPGEGPLGGIITALRWGGGEVVVVAPCDMPWIEGAHARALVDALSDGLDVAVAGEQHLFAAWAPRALAVLEAAFAAGERSVKRVLPLLHMRTVDLGEGPWSHDVDTPADLPH